MSKNCRKGKFYSQRRTALIRNVRRCYWCDFEIEAGEGSLDHVIPLGRGGPHQKNNLVLACKPCNNAKADLLPEEMEIPCAPAIHFAMRYLYRKGKPITVERVLAEVRKMDVPAGRGMVIETMLRPESSSVRATRERFGEVPDPLTPREAQHGYYIEPLPKSPFKKKGKLRTGKHRVGTGCAQYAVE